MACFYNIQILLIFMPSLMLIGPLILMIIGLKVGTASSWVSLSSVGALRNSPRYQGLDSIESEYRSLTAATCELMWLQMLLANLRISQYHPPILWCDNIGATFLAANPVNHARTKHISVDYHFVREQVANKKLEVRFISSKDQLADTLTKSLCKQPFILSRDKLTVVAPRLSLRGVANIPDI